MVLPADPFDTPPMSCRCHPLQAHQAADIVDKVLQPDLCRRPFDTDCAHVPSSLRHFLGAKNMLDAGARLALVAVGLLLVFS